MSRPTYASGSPLIPTNIAQQSIDILTVIVPRDSCSVGLSGILRLQLRRHSISDISEAHYVAYLHVHNYYRLTMAPQIGLYICILYIYTHVGHTKLIYVLCRLVRSFVIHCYVLCVLSLSNIIEA